MPEISREKLFVMNTVAAALISRAALAARLDGPCRDLNKECGWPQTGAVDKELLYAMYQREGIGTRVVELMPQESWSVEPEIYDDDDEGVESPFEKAWKEFADQQNIFHYWERADEQCGIGQFGVMLLGVEDGLDLTRPLVGVDAKGGYKRQDKQTTGTPDKPANTETNQADLRGYSYTRVLSDYFASIGTTEQDRRSPRFGLPLTYNLSGSTVNGNNISNINESLSIPNVHWSRIIHLADNLRCSEILGTPRMEVVYNRLADIRKLLGGSAEMFWKGAFPGVSFEMDPRITAADATMDPVAVRREWEAYTNGLQRFIATEGLHANQLSVQVADPEMHLKVQLQAVAIALGVPLRILIGAEAAQLASQQDSKSWNGRLMRRQNRFLTPRVIRPTIDRLIACGVLPMPKDGKYCVKWPDLNTPTDNEKADKSLKLTQGLVQYASGNAESVVPPLEFLVHYQGFTQEVAQAIIDARDASEELYTDTSDPELDQALADDSHEKSKELKQMDIQGKLDLAKAKPQPPKGLPK